MRPDDAANLAKGLREIYLEAEIVLLQKIVRAISTGLDSPLWAEEKLLQTRALIAATDKVIDDLGTKSAREMRRILAEAYRRGVDASSEELTAAGVLTGNLAGIAPSPGLIALVTATTSNRKQLFQIRRAVADAYQEIVAKTSSQVVAGVLTTREAARQSLLDLAKAGIASFKDTSGRSWEMGAYAEMSARTATMSAYLQGTADRISDFGEDLIIVSDAPEECRLCRPYEHQVLSVSGSRAGLTLDDGTRVVASIDEARGKGLFHPNCRHSMSLYIPGVTRRRTDTADPEGDALRQKQRAFERRIRELKRQVAVADGFGGPDAVAARAKLRAKQAQFKAWREEHGRKNLAYRTNVNYR